MRSTRRVAQVVALLMVLQGVSGYVVNFVLLGPVIRGSPGWLVSAAEHAARVRGAALLGLLGGALTLGIAIALWPVLRDRSERVAVAFVALGAVGLATTAIEQHAVLGMLSLSQQYTRPAGADAAGFEMLRVAVGSARNSAHYLNLVVAGGGLLVFYAALFRYALVPRLLAGFGVVAVMLQLFTVSRPILGYPVVLDLLAPLGVSQLALASWLAVKGFTMPQPASPG